VPGSETKSRRAPDLWAVIAPACAAVAIGVLATILGALRAINPELQFRWDAGALLVGGIGATAGWFVGRAVARLADPSLPAAERVTLKRRVLWGFAGLGAATALGFALAAGGLPGQRRADMVVGSVCAVLVLGTVGWILRRLARLFGSPDDPDVPPGGAS